jgi:hypothetical protein
MSTETNIELVTRLMTFSPTGAMSQLFIMEAIGRYAKQVSEADMSGWPENHIINPEAWQKTARFINEELEKRNGT